MYQRVDITRKKVVGQSYRGIGLLYLRWLDGHATGLTEPDLEGSSRLLRYLNVGVQIDGELEKVNLS